MEKVTVEGWGETIESAKIDASKAAVDLVVGMYTASESLVRNGELINDEVLTYSNGYIVSFETVNSRKEDGFWIVNAEVEVEVGKVTQKLRDMNITTIGSPEFEVKVAGAFNNADKFRNVFKKEILDPIFMDSSAYRKEFLGMEPYVDDSSSALKERQYIYRFIPNDKRKYEDLKIMPFRMKFKVSLSDDYIKDAKKLYNYLANGDREEYICTTILTKKGKSTDCCNTSSVCIVELIDPPEQKNWLVGSKVIEYKFSSINNRIANSEFIKIRDLYDVSRHSGAYFIFEFFNEIKESIGKVVLGGMDPCKYLTDDKYFECEKNKGVVAESQYSSTPIITSYDAWGDPWHKDISPMVSGFYINKKSLISNNQEFSVIVLLDEDIGKSIKDVKFSIDWSKPNIL
jgi:hypothetical protein